ncbi:MAG: hypothetical protein LC634_05300, partial [Sphingomonadales bacterium]|nr:hypothetical protein [Sphingomonadales bacterium]
MSEKFRNRMAGPLTGLAATLLLLACGDGGETEQAAESSGDRAAQGSSADPSAGEAPGRPAAAWDLVSNGEGAALVFPASSSGETGPEETETAIRLFCPAGRDRILVNVPGFRPIASEERLSFGSGGAAHALVADTSGDRQRGGVSGTGAVPRNLDALIGGPVSASYGAQQSGPHPAPPRNLARNFAAACREGAPA